MKNQRIVLGAALGLEDMPHRLGVQSICTQAIYRLRRDTHQAPRTENFSGLADIIGCQLFCNQS